MTTTATAECSKNPTGRAHFWDLGSPHGSVVHGVCRYCQEERDFNNSVDFYDRGKDQPEEGKEYRRHQKPSIVVWPGSKPRPASKPAAGSASDIPDQVRKGPQPPPASPVSGPVTTTASRNQSLGAERLGQERAAGDAPKGGSMGLRKRTEQEVLEVVKKYGMISPAAAELGVSYSTLQEYVRRRGIDPKQYQPQKQKRETAPVSSGDLNAIMQELVRLGRRVDRLAELVVTPHFHVRYVDGKLVFECRSEQDCEMVRKLLKEKEWVVRQS